MQKGSCAFICLLLLCNYSHPIECAIFRKNTVDTVNLHVDMEQESESELAQLRLAAKKLNAFCEAAHNDTSGKPGRGQTGIASDQIADPHCAQGVVSPDLKACCAKGCGSCVDHKLCDNPGKYNEVTGKLVDQCCYTKVLNAGIACDKDHPPCALSKSYKETLKKWKQDLPDRHAMQDCNKAIPKTNMYHQDAIEKGEFLAQLYLNGETKYKEALKIADDVAGKCNDMIKQGSDRAAEGQAKAAKATKGDKVTDPMTGQSAESKWQEEAESGLSEAKFYKSIQDNAIIISKASKSGIVNVTSLRDEAQKVRDVSPLQSRLDTLITDAEYWYEEALKLWKQWLDSNKDYDCGPPPHCENAESMCESGNTKYSPTCNVKCATGYDGNGTMNRLHCDKVGKFGEELAGEWIGMATCAGKMCGLPPAIKHAKTVETPIRYPEAATYVCLEGFFTPEGEHGFNVPCGAKGFFESNSSHVCKAIWCNEAPVLAGTAPVEGKFKYPEEANYTCEEGHTLNGLPGGRTYFHTQCMATGQFSHGNMGCQPIRCGRVPEFAHTKVTHLTTEDEEDQHYGDEAEYACAPGYTLNTQPDGPNQFKLTCHSDGEFSLPGTEGDSAAHQPRCKPICIGKPPDVEHGRMSKRNMCFGDTVEVAAIDGYSVIPKVTDGLTFDIGVTPDGQFSGIKSFKPVDCGKPPEAKKAKTKGTVEDAVYQDIVVYECEKGYSTDKTKDPGSASFSIMCQDDGQFSSLPPLGGCGNIDDCIGHTCGSHGVCVDHLMNYTCKCDSGFAMTYHKKADQLICGNINDCGPEACGVGRCIDGTNSYSCNCPDGYHSVDEAAEGGIIQHTCAANSCGAPAEVDHASVEPVEAQFAKAFYGTTILYQCDTGYTLDGKATGEQFFTTYCQANKQFSALASCKAVTCDSPPTVKNAGASATSATFNETLEYECATGYSLDGSATGDKTFTVVCGATGVFSDPEECMKVSCGEAPDTSHAHHPMIAASYEETVEYTCFSGFTLDGAPGGPTTFETSCKADGTFAELKQCVPKVCGSFSDGEFEHAYFKDEGEIHYPMATEVTCLDGYTVNADPEGNKTFTVSCLASGKFSEFDHKQCKPVICGMPPQAPNATVISEEKEMVFHDHVTYECDVGFTTGGEQGAPMTYEVACLASGGFSSPTPDMICRNVNDCEGHTCGPFGTCVDLIGPAPAYTCDCQYGYIVKKDKDGEKHCGNKDDCKGVDCGVGVCKDLIGSYTCTCPGGYYVGIGDDGKKTCIPVTCAETVPQIDNGKLASSRVGPVTFPHTLTYKCDKGYSVDGTPVEAREKFQAQCKADGQLHGLATCQKISCGTPPGLEHTVLLSPESDVSSVDYKEKAKYQCDDGYTLKGIVGGEATFEMECMSDGHLTNSEVCEPVLCGKAPTIDNCKAAIANEMHFGQTVLYACDTGYTLNAMSDGLNEFELSCMMNGSFSNTVGAFGTDTPCKPLTTSIPEIENAYLYSYSGELVENFDTIPTVATYPDSFTFKCKAGYTKNGKTTGQTSFSAVVTSSGDLQPSLPDACVAITYNVRGLTKDAPSAANLDGVEVHIKDLSISTAVSAGGRFAIMGLPAGQHTFQYHKDGYISGEKIIDVEKDITTGGNADISMSPVLAANAWRVVLKWGVKPRDLDTYGVWGSNKACWYQKTQEGNGLRARLEHDDTNSYGPETLHLTGLGDCTGGAYYCDIKYKVNDYTRTGIMGQTDVEITLYNGDRIAGTWKIADCQDTVTSDQLWWHVFTLNGMTNEIKWNCNQGQSPPPANPDDDLLEFHAGNSTIERLAPTKSAPTKSKSTTHKLKSTKGDSTDQKLRR